MKKILLITLLLALLLSACSVNIVSPDTVKGSGVVASETRSVSVFNAIELAGSADVNVSFGDTQSVVVEAEDNILPLIETKVQGGELVIDIKPNTSITPTKPIRVMVMMKSLEAAGLPGSGNITIDSLNADTAEFDLPGSGNITVSGVAKTVNVTLGGSGNILCGDLQAQNARVKLNGSGNVTVFASESLDANISGSGNVTYRGDPPKVNKSVTGSGSVQAEP